MHRTIRLATQVPIKGDQLHVMWDVDASYYRATVSEVTVHDGKRFHDLSYKDHEHADAEYYVDLSLRKWYFHDDSRNAYPRKEREDDHPEMNPADYPSVGDEVEIQWNVDKDYYPGVVAKVHKSPLNALFHDIEYDSEDVELFLDLAFRKWCYKGQKALEEEEEERVEEARELRDFDEQVAQNVKRLVRS